MFWTTYTYKHNHDKQIVSFLEHFEVRFIINLIYILSLTKLFQKLHWRKFNAGSTLDDIEDKHHILICINLTKITLPTTLI